MQRNPFITILLILALIGLIGGGALVVVGLFSPPSYSDYSQGILVGVGTSALASGGFFLIIWISVSAITWAIFHAPDRVR